MRRSIAVGGYGSGLWLEDMVFKEFNNFVHEKNAESTGLGV